MPQQHHGMELMGAIKMAMEQISKQYGAGSIMKFGDVAANMQRAQFLFGDLANDLTGYGEYLYLDVLRHFLPGYRKHKGG